MIPISKKRPKIAKTTTTERVPRKWVSKTRTATATPSSPAANAEKRELEEGPSKDRSQLFAQELVKLQAVLSSTAFVDQGQIIDRRQFLRHTSARLEFGLSHCCPHCFFKPTSWEPPTFSDRYSSHIVCRDCEDDYTPVVHAVLCHVDGSQSREPFVWLGRVQTRDQYYAWREVTHGRHPPSDWTKQMEELAMTRPEIYWNAIRHCADDTVSAPNLPGLLKAFLE